VVSEGIGKGPPQIDGLRLIPAVPVLVGLIESIRENLLQLRNIAMEFRKPVGFVDFHYVIGNLL
jgi:hypothetical protein